MIRPASHDQISPGGVSDPLGTCKHCPGVQCVPSLRVCRGPGMPTQSRSRRVCRLQCSPSCKCTESALSLGRRFGHSPVSPPIVGTSEVSEAGSKRLGVGRRAKSSVDQDAVRGNVALSSAWRAGSHRSDVQGYQRISGVRSTALPPVQLLALLGIYASAARSLNPLAAARAAELPRAGWRTVCSDGIRRPARTNRWFWMLPPLADCGRHNQSPSRKARRRPGGWYRPGLTCGGLVRSRARSLIVKRSACRYIDVVSICREPPTEVAARFDASCTRSVRRCGRSRARASSSSSDGAGGVRRYDGRRPGARSRPKCVSGRKRCWLSASPRTPLAGTPRPPRRDRRRRPARRGRGPAAGPAAAQHRVPRGARRGGGQRAAAQHARADSPTSSAGSTPPASAGARRSRGTSTR